MKLFILSSAACILLSAVPGVFSSEVSISMWNSCLSLFALFLSSLCSFVPFQDNQLRGSPSAVAINVDEEFEQVDNGEAQSKRKKSGLCGSNKKSSRSAEDEHWCTCMNQTCCGGKNKCEKNRSTCTTCGFNCVSSDEDMPWNKGLTESNDCQSEWYKSGESICNEACTGNLVFTQHE